MKSKPSFLSIMSCIRSKYKERISLVRLIESRGSEMPPCSYCERNNRKCIVSNDSSSRCSECVHRGERCDVQGPSLGDLDSILRERTRLDEEEKETTAKLLHLQTQRRFLDGRAWDMLVRGLKTMDELDEAEEKERQEKENSERASREAAVTVPAEPSDPFALDPSLVLDQAFWVEMGFGDGIPPTSQGN
jgi:hypothetical protein